MNYDVVVVGAGIGGLTVAALLAKRGLSTCVLERQAQVGGCISRVEFGGFEFEPGMGIYPEWGPGELYQRLFAELAIDAPKTSLIAADYVVRLAGDCDVALKKNEVEFFAQIRKTFPECKDEAVGFYEKVIRVNQLLSVSLVKNSFGSSLRRLWTARTSNNDIKEASKLTAATLATGTSTRFLRFIDAQLKAFIHTSIDRCSFATASRALTQPRLALYSIEGGVPTLAERLAESIKASGGLVRLNTPVLRLAYSDTGDAIGVDLLSGERVLAKRWIVSNLTVWDTFGKLIGLNKTPPFIKSNLNQIQGNGAYLIFAAVDSSALPRLPAPNFLVAGIETRDDENLSGELAVTIQENSGGSSTATIKTGTQVASWFSFQASEEDYEEWDQTTLEKVWSQLHACVPEFGAGIEVIETANPRTYYDSTRRKLGMVMGTEAVAGQQELLSQTAIPFPNVVMVGDTTSAVSQVSSVTAAAIALAAKLV